LATTSDIRKGLTIEWDGKFYVVVEFQHIKPGKGQAFVKTRLKNLETQQVLETNFKVGTTINIIKLETKKCQYLYNDGDAYYFMDLGNYDQYNVSKEIIGDNIKYLKENMEVDVGFIKGRIISISIPIFVELEIVETEPGIRGDTAQGGTKPAKIETGAVITVPLFVNKGDVVKIDTRTGEYLERAK